MQLGSANILREPGRNRVLRCSVARAPKGSPDSVIVKAAVDDTRDGFASSDDHLESTAWRFYNECAGTALLESVGGQPALSAKLHASDKASGLLITEDLGTGECLADLMQTANADRLESGLFAYAKSLGRLHAATIGHGPEFDRLRRELGGSERRHEREGARWLREYIPRLKAQCEALQVPLATGFDDEAVELSNALDSPGPFLAFTPGDTCPDNHRFISEDALCFFDFEFGGFRHALLDAAYLRSPFPTCWCVNRLPQDLIPRLEQVYRTQLGVACPEAMDDQIFFPALIQACAYWAFASVSWDLETSLQADHPWGIATHRQRHPVRLANFAEASAQFGVLPAMGETAKSLELKLRALWPEVEYMPLYPPFQ